MNQSELAKLSTQELISLSENNYTDFRWDRSAIYKIAMDKFNQGEDIKNAENMKKEMLIFDLSIKDKSKQRFDSLMSGTNAKGEIIKYPDIEKDFPVL